MDNETTTRNGLKLYRNSTAHKQIKMLAGSNIRILGIDAFILEPSRTIPQMEWSVDLSQQEDAKIAATLAIEHLENLTNKDLWFEIIFDM